ncbi:efflux RND transporter periplasmic adaptor subunit [Paludisphaera rhizosphaerae]|uniref:efflux RND transporter periplasmic adaptor subunit n=1 Tax=Paludisphaera rhizosphaerae TaxID=2711216 RepID=UPI0013ECDFE7|nr:efflux RND transporter periplasmic adaptor subunit [Paludisphaera rhizosphaerae]
MTSASRGAADRGRRYKRVFLTATLATAFTIGVAVLMMELAGVFEPKVKVGTSPYAAAPPAPTGSEVAAVKRVRRPRRESAVGTVRAVHEAVVGSKILARVEEVRVKAGQDVKQGDVLVVLDKADLQSRLQQALAEEAAAEAKYNQSEVELGRVRRLRAREASTQSELDQAATSQQTAKAERDRAHRAVEEARIMESYATVLAPIAGRIVDKQVNAGDTVSPGQALVTMYDPTRMQMIATVRESLAVHLSPGQELAARLDTLDVECHATVSEIVPEAQAESRSFQVKVTGPCPPNVYSGMFGRIFIPLEDEEVLVLPSAAVRRVGQLDEVDVVEDGRVNRRVVQLGRTLGEGREVLSGLKEGESVVLLRGDAAHKAGGGS